jgi:hypothetical protein
MKSETQIHHERIFLFLWGISTVFQLFALSAFKAVQTGSSLGIVEFFMLVTALWLVAKPESRRAALLLLIFHVAALALRAPAVPSHRTTVFVINVAMLAGFLAYWLRSKKDASDSSWFAYFLPVARLQVLLVYFFACFHKLNSSFTSLEHSCASAFYLRFASWFPFAPNAPWAAETAIHATLVIEGTLPLLLFIPRTRHIAIVLGVLFHSILSVDYHQHTMDFSSIMFALLVLFVSDKDINAARKLLTPEKNGLLYPWRMRFTLWALLFGTALFGLYASEPYAVGLYNGMRHAIWYSFAAFVLFFVVFARSKVKEAACPDAKLKLPKPRWLLLCNLIAIAIGVLPYLGIHHRSSFDMYSNLKIVGNKSNHYIWTHPFDLFGHTADLVQVTSTSLPRLQSDIVEPGLYMTYFELQSLLSENPEAQITYIRGGVSYELKAARDSAEFQSKPHWLTRKLLWYRHVDLNSPGHCQW